MDSRKDLSELRCCLFGLLCVFCMTGAIISFTANIPLLGKIFYLASIGLFFWWMGVLIWQVTPHKLYEYYASDDVSIFQKILWTVFWLSAILSIACGGAELTPEGYVADNLADKIMSEWPRPYIHYIFALTITSGLGTVFCSVLSVLKE